MTKFPKEEGICSLSLDGFIVGGEVGVRREL